MLVKRAIAKKTRWFWLILAGIACGAMPVSAQDLGDLFSSGGGGIVVDSVQVGPHPDFTRILINLNREVKYQVHADFVKKSIILRLPGTSLGAQARSRAFKDANLERIDLKHNPDEGVEVAILLQNKNSRFFHLLKTDPHQIVVDIKAVDQPIYRARFKEERKKQDPGDAAPHIVGAPAAQLKEDIAHGEEDKQKSGWEDYRAALMAYQKRKYEEALTLFAKFRAAYPTSPYLADIAYLTAQAEYIVATRFTVPRLEKPLESFKWAIREYPDSKFKDHALSKLIQIYEDLGLSIETRSIYEESLRSDKKGRYRSTNKARFADILAREKLYEEAYNTYQDVLKENPKSVPARDGIFSIARGYYDLQEFEKALGIYEDGEKRWAHYVNQQPEILFAMAEIYYQSGRYAKAREHYFSLVNVTPDTELGTKSLNRIGDTYFMENNDTASLAVFDESVKKKGLPREVQYARIRIADIGVRNPNLKVRDMMLKLDDYFHPFKTYDEVLKNPLDRGIMTEALLSRGIAYLRGQRYIEAMEQFKLLLASKPDKRFAEAAEKYLKQTLVSLVDKFTRQNGYLPTLYAYGDYLTTGLGEINDLKTLLEIGESFQAIGMYEEAVKHYEHVKRLDHRKTYSDRILLNLGYIHLEEKKYGEAAKVAQVFMTRFPRSDQLPKALKLLADSQFRQELFQEAVATYSNLLEKNTGDAAELHYRIGQIHFKTNKLPEAIASFKSAIDTFDRNATPLPTYVPTAHYLYGITLYKNQELDKAIEALKRARQLYPDNTFKDWADYLIANSYLQQNQEGQAMAEMKEISKSGKVDELLKQVADIRLKMFEFEKQIKDIL